MTAFYMATEIGHLMIVEMLIKKSTNFNIELNTKDHWGRTAFHIACLNGNSKILDMLIQKSIESNIELNAKDLGVLWLYIKPVNMVNQIL